MADTLVRVPLPQLNEERREELVKIAGKYTELSACCDTYILSMDP